MYLKIAKNAHITEISIIYILSNNVVIRHLNSTLCRFKIRISIWTADRFLSFRFILIRFHVDIENRDFSSISPWFLLYNNWKFSLNMMYQVNFVIPIELGGKAFSLKFSSYSVYDNNYKFLHFYFVFIIFSIWQQ